MNPIIERVKEIAAELQALCPGNVSVTLAVSQYVSDAKASVELVLHGRHTYAAAVVDTGEFIEVERQKVVCGRPLEVA